MRPIRPYVVVQPQPQRATIRHHGQDTLPKISVFVKFHRFCSQGFACHSHACLNAERVPKSNLESGWRIYYAVSKEAGKVFLLIIHHKREYGQPRIGFLLQKMERALPDL